MPCHLQTHFFGEGAKKLARAVAGADMDPGEYDCKGVRADVRVRYVEGRCVVDLEVDIP